MGQLPHSWSVSLSICVKRQSLIRNDVRRRHARFSADIRPLCASTMVRAMDSPMPIPSALLVTNGSKTSFSLSAGMPGPLSDIESSAKFSTRDVRMLMLRSSLRRVGHRVDRIDHQVQNDLLKLNAVADDRERDRRRTLYQFDLPSDRPVPTEIRRVSRTTVVEVEILQLEGRLSQQAAHPPNDLAGAPVILQNIVDDIAGVHRGRGAKTLSIDLCRLGVGRE